MIDTKKIKCTGCTGCYSICPKNAISMEENEEGFLYPIIDKEKCINCGLCEKVCPKYKKDEKEKKKHQNIEAFLFQNKDKTILNKASSGGVFEAISKEIIKMGGSVFAVGYNEELEVVTKEAKTYDEVKELMGSKYVQSNLKDTFRNICENLQKDKIVFFVGTPCQVEGLLSFLKLRNIVDFSNLYTAELYCYGVPSPGIYKKWINYIEKKYNSKVKSINFRDKKYGYYGANTKIEFENNIVIEDCLDAKSFLKTMFSNYGLRQVCYECTSKRDNKQCDFEFGDILNYKKVEDITGINDYDGITLLNVCSDKGNALIEKIDGNFIKIENEYVDQSKNSLRKIPKKRTQFFKDYNELEYNEFIEKYYPSKMKDFMANKVKPLIIFIPGYKKIIKSIRLRRVKKKQKGVNE